MKETRTTRRLKQEKAKKWSLELIPQKQKLFGLILIVSLSQIYSQPNKID